MFLNISCSGNTADRARACAWRDSEVQLCRGNRGTLNVCLLCLDLTMNFKFSRVGIASITGVWLALS